MGLLSLLSTFCVCGKVVHLEGSLITLKDMFTKSLWNMNNEIMEANKCHSVGGTPQSLAGDEVWFVNLVLNFL